MFFLKYSCIYLLFFLAGRIPNARNAQVSLVESLVTGVLQAWTAVIAKSNIQNHIVHHITLIPKLV